MTHILASRPDKERSLKVIFDVLRQFLLPRLAKPQANAVLEQHNWMLRQPGPLRVNCQYETVPELQMVRITLEMSFEQIPPMKKQ